MGKFNREQILAVIIVINDDVGMRTRHGYIILFTVTPGNWNTARGLAITYNIF